MRATVTFPAPGTRDEMRRKEHYRRAVWETPFHPRTSALNVLNEWHRWKDYTTADAYFDEQLEYAAIRNACAVFDLTPMTKHRITGPDALAFLNRLITRDVSRIKPARVGYCVWCDDNGQVIDDGTVFHLRAGDYRLCSQERQLDWLTRSAHGFDVTIVEETHDVAALALQGPTSCAVLKAMELAGVQNLKPFDIAYYPFAGGELMVSRTGFTGDLGYELWIDPERALALWDALFDRGARHGIRPMGTHALEVSRIEAGFLQAGVDFHPADQAIRLDRSRSPFELDLARLVDFAKPNFNGRRALLEERRRGSRFRFVRLDVEGNKPARSAYIYDKSKNVVGTVTSAEWSPSAKKNIAFASMHVPWGRPGDELWAEIYYQRELKWSRVMARCRVVEAPFWDPPRRRATPAADF